MEKNYVDHFFYFTDPQNLLVVLDVFSGIFGFLTQPVILMLGQ